METLPVPVAPADVQDPSALSHSEAFKDALDAARGFALSEKSDATRAAYESDYRHFAAWCSGVGAEPMPASVATVCAYLAHCAGERLKVSTIDRRTAAIAYAHRLHGFPQPPTQADPVKAVLRGIRRRAGVAVERKAPATARAITGMIKRLPDTIIGKRDRALLLLGFAAALRRSELVGLNVEDLERTSEGVLVHIRKSKTDQEGAGHVVAVPRGGKLRPVEALDAWLEAAGISSGPVFRSIRKGGLVQERRLSAPAVAEIVKQAAARAKLDPALWAGHSLRSGFVTSALEAGADLFRVMDVTRHRSVDTLRGYDRRAKAFKDHAGRSFL